MGQLIFPGKKNATDFISRRFQRSASHGQASAVPVDQVIPAQENKF